MYVPRDVFPKHIRRVIDMANLVQNRINSIISWIDYGMMPPTDVINDMVSNMYMLLHEFMSIVKNLLKKEEWEQVEKLFKDSSYYLDKAEDKLIEAVVSRNIAEIRGQVIRYQRILTSFIFSSLKSAYDIWISEYSEKLLAQEILTRLGVAPTPESLKPKLRLGGE